MSGPPARQSCAECKGSGLINTENGYPATREEAHRSDVDQCVYCDGTGAVIDEEPADTYAEDPLGGSWT